MSRSGDWSIMLLAYTIGGGSRSGARCNVKQQVAFWLAFTLLAERFRQA
jgi:hypothetical protein